MNFNSLSIILISSTFGLILRIVIQNNLKKYAFFEIQNTSIVNFIASFLLGILVAINFINNKTLLLLYSGFLGSFSTFSSFIYKLFILFKNRKFLSLFLHYIEVIVVSFGFFYLGYFLLSFSKLGKKSFIYILLACYLGNFLRLFIDNNFIISLIGSFSVPVYLFLFDSEGNEIFFAIMFILIFYTHRENIKRLINKEENKTKIY